MKKKAIYDNLPDIIKAILLQSYGWLVGGAPDALISGIKVNDYDIVVENRQLYQEVIKTLSVSGFQLEINSFGGCKFTSDQVEIDIWCEELGHFIQTSTQEGHIYNFRRSKLLQLV